MASKLVTDREKSSRAVAAAEETHAGEIARGFASELAPYLKSGEAMPDVALLMRLIGRRITSDTTGLVAADDVHEQELADDAAPREARDEAALRVRAVLVDGRAAIDAAFGPAGLRKLRLEGERPERRIAAESSPPEPLRARVVKDAGAAVVFGRVTAPRGAL